MHEKYLGDSYDLVKRFWRENLKRVAPLYAHPRFVPVEIRARYTSLTSIPIFESRPRGQFGILLDPHTGIPLPGEAFHATASHAPLQFLVRESRVAAELHDLLRPEL